MNDKPRRRAANDDEGEKLSQPSQPVATPASRMAPMEAR